ncbi:MAG TPA: AmmeMemoRadiSam system protein B [bacterium]|nr:AmmeMemoRadiSam system protein B [bacterium]
MTPGSSGSGPRPRAGGANRKAARPTDNASGAAAKPASAHNRVAAPGPFPRLRPLDLIAAEWNGERVVCARDYEGLLDGPVIVPLPVMLVGLLLDGRRDARAVQVEYARLSGGMLLRSEDLEHIVQDLDAHGLLDSPALTARRRAVADAYRAAPHRVMAHAGTGYPADPEVCAASLARYLEGTRAGDGANPAAWPRGILAPHIDFGRGGLMYGRAYASLSRLPGGVCVMVVGVAHAGSAAPYVLTSKGFETPFGIVDVDRPLLDAVVRRVPFDPLAEEPVHRGEHSIEFQVLWLAHLLRGRPFTVLPVLTGPLDAWVTNGSPAVVPEIDAFVAAMREAIAEANRPVCIVGGVDLSHVGPRFGDEEPVGAALARRASDADRAALRHVEAGDAEGWWRAVAQDGNRCHVCGLGAIYTVLRLLAPVKGRVLGYDQGVDPAGGLVGFSAVLFE